jgi:predicted transposase YdaD
MEHDNSYKLLFSHARMVEDLLRGFIQEPWVQEVDFTTLERVSESHVSDDLHDREDDLIWRVRWRADWLYIYLLLEFQSTADRSPRTGIWRCASRYMSDSCTRP